MDPRQPIDTAFDTEPTEAFERSDLQDANALDFPFVRPSDLDNPIHPIFRKSNWSGTSVAVYTSLTPALRLASLFITQNQFLTWWCTLTHGRLEVDRISQRRTLRAVKPTRRAMQRAREALEAHADKIRFSWFRKATDEQFGETAPDPTKNGATSVIKLHRDFIRFTRGEYSSSTLSHQLRFQLFFAINLVHELAHSVYWTPASTTTPEPFLADEPQNEFGASWEFFAFGGKIQPINAASSVNADSGLMFYEWTPQSMYDSLVYRALPMNYVNSFFSQARWETVLEYGTGQFKAPVDAVCKSLQPMTSDHPEIIALSTLR